MFTLEALQGNDGDCMLLHYSSDVGAPVHILIDGGSRGVYTKLLRPRLDELRGNGVLNLRMVMVSHIDADHVTGIVDLFRDMVEAQTPGSGVDPFCKVKTLWHNSFEQLAMVQNASIQSAVVAASSGAAVPAGLSDQAAAVVASIQQGNDLRNYATRLTVPINQSAVDPLIKAPTQALRVVKIAEGLTFTILGPNDEQLEKLDKDWQKAKLKPTPEPADYLNRTVPNLSSIVILAEAKVGTKSKRMLLTGDAGGDHIRESLENRGLLDRGKIHVDLLKVQHHGSKHSVDQDFFSHVTADHYVISGNGKHGIPHSDTLQWLSDARPKEAYVVYMTNRKGVDDLEIRLDAFLSKEKTRPNHVYHFRAQTEKSISVVL